ncbi:MAG: efflux RND transporter periplasmic adaptor subunit [Gemmatimonadaceae bacterium]
MNLSSRSRRILTALAAIAALSPVACKKGDATGKDSTDGAPAAAAAAGPGARKDSLSLPVVAEEARDGDLVLRVNTTGMIRSEAVVKLTAEVGGVIVQLPVRSGAPVKKGDVILRLDPQPFEMAVRSAQTKLDAAQQNMLESYAPESIVTKRAPTADQRKAFAIKAQLPSAQLDLEKAKIDQEKSVLYAPFDGVLDAVVVTLGERVNASQAIATIVDPTHLRVDAQVFEHDLAVLRAGNEAFITSAGAPGRELHGRVETILPMLDSATHAGRAVVRFEGDGRLRPGMYAEVQLESMRLPHRRLVPARAVIERDGRPLVFVVRDGRAQWTYIEVGRSNGVDTEVLPDTVTGVIPVNPGDKIIVDGHLTLTHDASVTITAIRDKGVVKSPSAVEPARKPKP